MPRSSRVLKFAWQNMWRNLWLSIVTLTTLVLVLISLTALFAVNAVTDAALTKIQSKLEVAINFLPTAIPPQVDDAKIQLLALPGLDSITSISKEEALLKFKERTKDNATIQQSLQELGDNPFGPALVLHAQNPAGYDQALKFIQTANFKDIIETTDIPVYQDIVAKLDNLTNQVKRGAGIMAGFFGLLALIVAFNTVRVSIYSQREEIGIMKLVGATNGFISWPYVIDGSLYAVLATILTIAICLPLAALIEPTLKAFLNIDSFSLVQYLIRNSLSIFGLELLIAVVINIVASAIAVRKYLKV